MLMPGLAKAANLCVVQDNDTFLAQPHLICYKIPPISIWHSSLIAKTLPVPVFVIFKTLAVFDIKHVGTFITYYYTK
jgi:hypothetical protein